MRESIIFLLTTAVNSQKSNLFKQPQSLTTASSSSSNINPCILPEALKKCDSCINAHPDCRWCESHDLLPNVTRCESIDFWNQNNFCKSKNSKRSFLVGETSSHAVTVDKAYSKKGNKGEIVQMRPQNIHVKLRKGDKKELTFKFKLADDYPVDLYYLMDLS